MSGAVSNHPGVLVCHAPNRAVARRNRCRKRNRWLYNYNSVGQFSTVTDPLRKQTHFDRSFSRHNHNLSDTAGDCFQFSELDTYSYGESGTDISSQQLDPGVASGSDTFTGLGTVLSNASSTDSYTRSFTETLTQSSSSTYALSQQGSFGTESYAFSSLVYQNSASARETFQYAASDAYSAGGGYSNVSNATQSSLGTVGASLACGTALGTTTASGNWSSQGTTTVHETVTDANGWSLYESGSFSLDSYTLGSMAYGESASSSFSFQQVDCSSATGNDTFTSLGTNQGTGTTAYGPWLFTAKDTGNASSTAVDSYTQSSTQTLTQSGRNSYTLSEQGSFAADSWSLSTVVYQASGSWSQEIDYAANNSVATAGTIINSQSANQTNSYTDPAFADSALGCYTSTDTTTYATQDSAALTETVVNTSGWTQYRAGAFSQGSYALTSVAYSESYAQTDNFHGDDSGSAFGAETFSSAGTVQQSHTFTDANTVLSSYDSAAGTTSYAGSYTQGYTQSQSRTSTANSSYSAQGVFNGGSFAYSSVVYQAWGGSSGTLTYFAFADSGSSTALGNSANGSQSSNDSYGTGSDTALGSYTNSDSSPRRRNRRRPRSRGCSYRWPRNPLRTRSSNRWKWRCS